MILGRKAMINLDSILKCRGISLPKEVHIVKAMVFPVVTYRDFPGSPRVKTLPSNARGEGLIPGQGDKVPHTGKPKLLAKVC